MKILVTFFILQYFSFGTTTFVRFDAVSDTELDEGETKVIYANTMAYGTCSVLPVASESTADASDYSLTGQHSSTNFTDVTNFPYPGSGSFTFTLSIIPDGDSFENLTLELKCASLTSQLSFNITGAPGGNGDPHFLHKIKDHMTNLTRSICYDVIGQRNQHIKIFTDSKFKTELYGQLKDDYYMHKIILKMQNQIVRVDVDKIYLPSETNLNWEDGMKNDWLELENYFFMVKKDKLFVKANKNDKLTYGILRKMDDFGKYYMDIALYGLSDNYSGKDGLIGKIGNKKISIYPTVQSYDEKTRTTVIVDGQRTTGYEKLRNGQSCMLISVNDLLFPDNIDTFLFNNLNF